MTVKPFSRLTSAERLLKSLGITAPAEIHLEAIAHTMGAKVKYRRLDGCAARITGTMEKAVITVDSASSPARRRFSVGHEIGHWRHHRGQAFECKTSDIGSSKEFDPHDPERVADKFAADLLMPAYLFRPAADAIGKMTMDAAKSLASTFEVSLTAGAIRLVDIGPEPAMLICHDANGRKWFRRHRDVPEFFFPRRDLDPESFAADVLAGKTSSSRASPIGADAWIDFRRADHFEVIEQSVKGHGDTVLTMIWWKDESQIEDAL